MAPPDRPARSSSGLINSTASVSPRRHQFGRHDSVQVTAFAVQAAWPDRYSQLNS
ncbi:hypothetical protein JG688_00008314 [Phytophthora aleatoria]|uniref:Uncharacterized protein n=1 Tax=Phytophthora aleatoria TaxID=2496075 RepID=A0A8J5IVK4_9STRA|nr:hypothetical protein JG688_00008314 [Phytophthora aleatoria]